MISASAPAGNASSISGKLSAASTSATSDGDDDSDVISQPAPTSCIHVPTFDTMVAIQRARKRGLRSGLHADDDEDAVALLAECAGEPFIVFRSSAARVVQSAVPAKQKR